MRHNVTVQIISISRAVYGHRNERWVMYTEYKSRSTGWSVDFLKSRYTQRAQAERLTVNSKQFDPKRRSHGLDRDEVIE